MSSKLWISIIASSNYNFDCFILEFLPPSYPEKEKGKISTSQSKQMSSLACIEGQPPKSKKGKDEWEKTWYMQMILMTMGFGYFGLTWIE